jgi:hypothetical protein
MLARRKKAQRFALILTVWVLTLTFPCTSILAAIIETETVLKASKCVGNARDNLHRLLARDDIQSVLTAQDIDPAEASTRLDCLSDDEILRMADRLEELPAGGNGGTWGIVGIAVVVACIILLITDLLGYTDMFDF